LSTFADRVRDGVEWSSSEGSYPPGVPLGINGVSKRAFDLAIALALVVFVSPLLLAIWSLIRLSDGGHAIFRQQRFGREGRVFTCYKFRTMAVDADDRLDELLKRDSGAAAEWANGQKLRNDPRITPLGRFLRKSSLDELPQLINIIRGEMSIVGPRPIIHNEIVKYGDYYAYYTATRPGVTGLWQVSGRNLTSYQQRVALDAQYVREWTLLKDVIIILRTVPTILFGQGAF
jgi:exopolysaccharide production protein ExoY